MRATVIFLYFVFHLLAGDTIVHATSHDDRASNAPQSYLSQRDQIKFFKTIQGSILFATAEFDLEEELSGSESFKSTNATISTGKHHLSKVWYLTFYCQSILNHYYKNFKIFAPSCGQSNPIYIIQQVLRL